MAMAQALGFLEQLPAETAAELRAAGHVRRFARDTALFHQGDDSSSVLVLLSGRVKVTALTPDGREVIVALRGPGELVGEVSAIDGGPRFATVSTLEPVEAIVLRPAVFVQFLDAHLDAEVVVRCLFAERLRAAGTHVTEIAAYDVVGRLVLRLLDLAERYGETVNGQVEIELPLSQEELATWIGCSREAMSRGLQMLRKLGLIETSRGRIMLPDVEALRRAAM
jgi:CRP/FNR family transcriptional regulator, cyclic AMP receptor protein